MSSANNERQDEWLKSIDRMVKARSWNFALQHSKNEWAYSRSLQHAKMHKLDGVTP